MLFFIMDVAYMCR